MESASDRFCQKCGARFGRGGREPVAVQALRKRHRRLVIGLVIIVAVGAVIFATADPGAEILFVLAVAPSSYILWHFHHADKYKEESTKLLLGTFGIGAGLCLVAAAIEFGVPEPPADNVLLTFLYYLVGIGLVEETMKFIAVRLFSYRSVHFDEAMDGVIFGIAAALGFATFENILYVSIGGIETALLRAFVSVPGHAFWGAIIGYYLGEAKVRRKPLLALQGLAFATILHGLYDTVSAVAPDAVSLIVTAGLVWIVYFEVVRKDIAKAQRESIYRPPYAPLRSLGRDSGLRLALL